MVFSLRLAILSWAFMATLSGCAPAEAPTPKPIPPELAPLVEREERQGRLIYAKDSAAAFATDAIIDQLKSDGRSRGWIVVPSGDDWLVRFMTADAKAIFDVSVMPGRPAKVVASKTAQDVPGSQASMFRARQTAARQDFKACSTKYNSVVLASEAGEGWTVYLLAATTEPGKILVGGHHRFEVSSDGRSVTSAIPLSNTCLTLNKDRTPEGQRVVAHYVTHLVTPTPIAIHLFLSLLHGKEFFVGTREEHLWTIQDGTIIY